MRIFFCLWFFYTFPFETIAGAGDTYVCEEKEINGAGYKGRHILYWNKTSYTIKDEVRKGSKDISKTVNFTFQSPDYFFSVTPYGKGHLIITFDGETYANTFTEKNYTVHGQSVCQKF